MTYRYALWYQTRSFRRIPAQKLCLCNALPLLVRTFEQLLIREKSVGIVSVSDKRCFGPINSSVIINVMFSSVPQLDCSFFYCFSQSIPVHYLTSGTQWYTKRYHWQILFNIAPRMIERTLSTFNLFAGNGDTKKNTHITKQQRKFRSLYFIYFSNFMKIYCVQKQNVAHVKFVVFTLFDLACSMWTVKRIQLRSMWYVNKFRLLRSIDRASY